MNITLAVFESDTPRGYLPIVMWCLVALYLYFTVRVTIAVMRSIPGIAAAVWVLVCWLIPFVGPIAAWFAVRQRVTAVRAQT